MKGELFLQLLYITQLWSGIAFDEPSLGNLIFLLVCLHHPFDQNRNSRENTRKIQNVLKCETTGKEETEEQRNIFGIHGERKNM